MMPKCILPSILPTYCKYESKGIEYIMIDTSI